MKIKKKCIRKNKKYFEIFILIIYIKIIYKKCVNLSSFLYSFFSYFLTHFPFSFFMSSFSNFLENFHEPFFSSFFLRFLKNDLVRKNHHFSRS